MSDITPMMRILSASDNPYANIVCETRDSIIKSSKGEIISECKGVEVPVYFSQTATDILADKYLVKRGIVKEDRQYPEVTPIHGLDNLTSNQYGQEHSYLQVVNRMVKMWADVGIREGYFDTSDEHKAFYNNIAYMMLIQAGVPNSPQFFNTGKILYGIKGNANGHFYIRKNRTFNDNSPISYSDEDFESVMKDNTDSNIAKCYDAYSHPQVSACFIQSIKDDLVNPGGIEDRLRTEALLFKYGSGSGINYSNLRGKNEPLSGGGHSSGSLSWMKIFDVNAGAIKSGGTTRRAAKMDILNIDHPDVEEFIHWKQNEERKAKVLAAAGYGYGFEDESYTTVSGQNSNNSISVTDEFMRAVEEDSEWNLIRRTDGSVSKTVKAKDLWRQIAETSWECADPGLHFNTTMNEWHTCSISGKINGSNPCSEYIFLDDTACNLQSFRLTRFYDYDQDKFLVDEFVNAVENWITVLDISVGMASYPTQEIAQRSYEFRTLGMGHADGGSFLMTLGHPYDSNSGRAILAVITALMTGIGYAKSTDLARKLGPFPKFEENREPMLKVIQKHLDAVTNINEYDLPTRFKKLKYLALEAWTHALQEGTKYGFRNAQISLMAPTGTIGMLMDCATTGVEPDFALIKYKKLAGGGHMKLVNPAVALALKRLKYNTKQIKDIMDYIDEHGHVEHAPHLEFGDYAIFDTASISGSGKRFIRPEGHLLMMAALQPFLSGAISKTVNLPNSATVEDIENIHMQAWILGLKAVAIYRDGSKGCQVLNTKKDDTKSIDNTELVELKKKLAETEKKLQDVTLAFDNYKKVFNNSLDVKSANPFISDDEDDDDHEADNSKDEYKHVNIARIANYKKVDTPVINHVPIRKRLPRTRKAHITSATIGGQKIYLTVGEYDDGTPGEIFIDMYKAGSPFRAMLDNFAIAISLGLQYGVPLAKYVDKFVFTEFEPRGIVNHSYIKQCTSVIDFIFRVLGIQYLERHDLAHVKPKIEKVSMSKDAADEKEDDSPSSSPGLYNKVPAMSPTSAARINPLTTEKLALTPVASYNHGPLCKVCGYPTVRNGTCYRCLQCGATSGCS